jgi:hypothetical protein
MGALTAADTVGCPLPLLPRITNVTFVIDTVLGKPFSCVFLNTKITGWVDYYYVTLTANNYAPMTFNLTGTSNTANNINMSIALSVREMSRFFGETSSALTFVQSTSRTRFCFLCTKFRPARRRSCLNEN